MTKAKQWVIRTVQQDKRTSALPRHWSSSLHMRKEGFVPALWNSCY